MNFDKIICVGKNYEAHIKEMGGDAPSDPVFFFKPPSALVENCESVELFRGRGDVHHEIEIVYRVKKTPSGMNLDQVTLGLDLTLRGVQNELKKKGLPWEAAKAFPRSAVIGPWISVSEFPDLLNAPFELLINRTVRQSGAGSQMIRKPNELLKLANEWFEVSDGDLLFTGTPEGVGELKIGDEGLLRWGPKMELRLQFT